MMLIEYDEMQQERLQTSADSAESDVIITTDIFTEISTNSSIRNTPSLFPYPVESINYVPPVKSIMEKHSQKYCRIHENTEVSTPSSNSGRGIVRQELGR